MPKYLDIDGLRTLWAQITNKIGQQSNSIAEALEGKADLIEGKIPASQLPSYVDDVLEYANKASFPATGESGKIYLDLATNLTYRWSGTAYTEISPSLALGTTSSTAYRGDYGAAAYKHAVTNKGIAKASGLYKITTNAEGHVTAATAVVKADITGLGIPAQDTTYENATTTTNGLMSSTDKTKLNSINLSALVKSVNGITPDSNGNVAIEVGGGTVSGEYLPLTGGTLTGELNYVLSDSNYYVRYKTSANATTEVAAIRFNGASSYRRFVFVQRSFGTDGYAESYVLPRVANSITANATYEILTTKSAVTIPQGGTGATTVRDAINNLGLREAPYLGSGDYADITDLNNLTLSGLFQVADNFTNAPLTNPCFILNVKGTNNRTTQFGWRSNRTDVSKNIYMRRQGDTAGTWDDWQIIAGPGLISKCITTSQSSGLMDISSTGNLYIRATKTDGTALQVLFKPSGNALIESYDGSSWTTANEILTTAKTVTVAQGGTGATTPEAARTALGVTSANINITTLPSNIKPSGTIGAGLFLSEMPSTALVTGDPTHAALLTAHINGDRGFQLSGGKGGTKLAFRYLGSTDTSSAGIQGVSDWFDIYHTGNKPTPADIGAAPTSHTHASVTTSGCTLGIGLYNNHPLLNVLHGTKQAWAIEKADNTYNLTTHFYKTDGTWQNSAVILNTLNCLEQGVRKIYYHYSQLGLTKASTSYEIWAALPNDSSFIGHNSNFSQVTDTPNGYGVVQITKTNHNYGAGSFTRVNVATSDFYQASFYLDRTFDGWRKVITSEGGVFSGTLEIKNGTDESTIHFTPSNSNAYGGILYYFKPTSSDKDRSRWAFRQYSFSASNPNTRTEHAHTYYLPKTPSGLTASSTYEILTSKNAVTVAQGGTGKTTLTSGYALIGNGTSAVSLRAITNNTAKGPLEWTSSTGTNLVTSNTLAYWNGAYTGTSSNITVLGTITKGVWNGSAIPITHGGTNATTATGARENLLIKVSATAPSSPTTGTIWVDIS